MTRSLLLCCSLIWWGFQSIPVQAQQLFFQHFNETDGLPNALVMTVECEKGGKIWIGTSKGLYHSKDESSFNQVNHKSLSKAYITRTDKTNDGIVWAATSDGRIYHYVKSGFNEVGLPAALSQKLTSHLVDRYTVAANGTGYVSTLIGGEVYYFDRQNFVEVTDTADKNNGYFIRQFNDGNIICGKYKGNNSGQDLVVRFKSGKQFSFTLSEAAGYSKNIVCLLSHNRYVYARGREVIIFDEQGVKERKFYHASVQVLVEDDEGKLWIGFAEGGLSCFPSGEISTQNFSRYFDRQSVYDIAMNEEGDLWFATSAGLYALPKMPDPTYVPPVYSNQLKDTDLNVPNPFSAALMPEISFTRPVPEAVVPEVSVTGLSINGLDTVPADVYQLSYSENFVSIEFAGLVNNSPGAVQYKYRLDGLDSNWVYSNSNKVVYQALSPGTYVFNVHAQHKSGNWSVVPARVTFIISTPFWKAPWFIILSVFLVLTLLTAVLLMIERVRKRQRIRDEEFKKQLMRSELHALRAQMNPHFTFNTLSSIQNFISQNDVPNATAYLSKFARLMRMIMENARQADVPLKDELAALSLYVELESLRMRHKFDHRIIVDEEIDQQYTRIPSMLIQPYVENAIWHGFTNLDEHGDLLIEIRQMGNFLRCVIDDNGVGRTAAMKISSRKKRHISKGMSITEERLEILNSMSESNLNVQITDKINGNKRPAGTKVEIFIPLKNE